MNASIIIDVVKQGAVCGTFNMSNTTVEEAGSRLYATLPRPDTNPKSPETPAHLPCPSSTKKVLHALGSFVPRVAFSGLAGALSSTATSAKMRVGSKTFSRLFFPLLFASNIALAGVGGATAAEEAERGVGLAIRGPDEGGRLGLRKLTTFPVNDHEAFYNKISYSGNAKMSNGDEVVATEGVYQCGTCYNSDRMYYISWLNGVIRCETDELECKLDGEGSRRVMMVDGTRGGTLSLRGFHIHRGVSSLGGGIYTTDDANVILSIMKFTECQATGSDWGGGAIFAVSGTINIYAVEFSGNSAASNKGDDIYTYLADAVTIHSTCPTDMLGGTPTQGENPACLLLATFPPTYPLIPSPLHRHTIPSGAALDTYTTGSSTISGPTNSYSKGTCGTYLCPAGSSNPTEGETSDSCVPCSAGESSSSGSTSCTPCAAGTYSGNSSSLCTPCARPAKARHQRRHGERPCDGGRISPPRRRQGRSR